MNYLYERVAYLRGLAEGMEVSDESKEGKLLLNIIDILEDFADAIDELKEEVTDLDEYVETLDEDLADVEDEVFGELEEDEDDEEDEDIDFVEVECPNCHEVIYLDEDLIYNEEDSEVICPSCHEKIHIEECDEHDHSHGCCGHHHHE